LLTLSLSISLSLPPQSRLNLNPNISQPYPSRSRSIAGRLLVFLLFADSQGEGVNEVSFMSEQAAFYLGSIGLLGEYCPSSRKKNRFISLRTGCMHLEPFSEYLEFHGCNCLQPFLTTEDQSSLAQKISEDNFSAPYFPNFSICFL
ncbi:hypothetical protein F2P56_000740, partial [Juglans regia]